MTNLSVALADPEPGLIYKEAKLLFNTVYDPQNKSSTPRSHVHSYYRRLFQTATEGLTISHQLKLLHICFAFKKKRVIMQWLNNLDPTEFDFVIPLRQVVEKGGRDTLFRVSTSRKRKRPDEGITMERIVEPGPYFVIPTLSLAYPATFFQAIVHQAPLNRLTARCFLDHPAVLLLPLDEALTTELQTTKLQAFLPPKEQQVERVSWKGFFEHLLQTECELLDYHFRRPVLDEDAEEYDEDDLRMYVMKWLSQRQMDGGSNEVSVAIRRRLKDTATGRKKMVTVEEPEDGENAQHHKEKEDAVQPKQKRTRVSWASADEVIS